MKEEGKKGRREEGRKRGREEGREGGGREEGGEGRERGGGRERKGGRQLFFKNSNIITNKFSIISSNLFILFCYIIILFS